LTELHKDKNFKCSIGHLVPGSIYEVDNVGMAFEDALQHKLISEPAASIRASAYHNVDFLLDLCEHNLVGDSDALEDMMCGAVDGLGRPDEVNVGKAAWRPQRQ
jgi:hypothetical protein